MILSDTTIRERSRYVLQSQEMLRIEPFAEHTKEPGQLSYGLSSYGYDLRLGRNFLLFSDLSCGIVDPLEIAAQIEQKKSLGQVCERRDVDQIIIPAGGFALAESMELIQMPEDCLGVILGKSTMARVGILLNTTPLEPGWRGIITLEISNVNKLPCRLRAGQGVGQLIFLHGDRPCEMPYNRKSGAMYHNQTGLTLPRVT